MEVLLSRSQQEEEEEEEEERERDEGEGSEGGERGGGGGGGDVLTEWQAWLPAVERVVKSTALSCLLLPLLVVVSNQQVCSLQMANTLQRSLSTLVQLAAQVSQY